MPSMLFCFMLEIKPKLAAFCHIKYLVAKWGLKPIQRNGELFVGATIMIAPTLGWRCGGLPLMLHLKATALNMVLSLLHRYQVMKCYIEDLET